MKILIYLYWRLLNYNRRNNDSIPMFSTYTQILALISVNIISMLGFLTALNGDEQMLFGRWLSSSPAVVVRFIKIPLLLSPIFILLILLLKLPKKRVEREMERLDNLSDSDKKKMNNRFLSYVIVSAILFIAGVSSPAWLR